MSAQVCVRSPVSLQVEELICIPVYSDGSGLQLVANCRLTVVDRTCA